MTLIKNCGTRGAGTVLCRGELISSTKVISNVSSPAISQPFISKRLAAHTLKANVINGFYQSEVGTRRTGAADLCITSHLVEDFPDAGLLNRPVKIKSKVFRDVLTEVCLGGTKPKCRRICPFPPILVLPEKTCLIYRSDIKLLTVNDNCRPISLMSEFSSLLKRLPGQACSRNLRSIRDVLP